MEKEESEKEDEGGIRLADLLTRFTSETSSSSSLASEARAISLLNRDVCPPVFVLGTRNVETAPANASLRKSGRVRSSNARMPMRLFISK
ncbi:hypothetical protein V1477_018656 [Vespula maculifrons]|uniref:Uncharacterized protein n=2 Tax=Vespula TaxID=7451 RepID=A0A834NLG9_VESVU|nr:hypothetical protein HZH66_001220 [Vespula vulgaris]